MEVWEVAITLRTWWFIRYRNIETPEDKKSWAGPIAAIGLLIIVVGIVLETYCEGKVADAETQLRNLFSETLTTAENEAASATRDAGTAKQSALISATAARDAVAVGRNATAVAIGARKQADSFEADIKSAKNGAADAVSRLADAEQRLADSTQRELAAEAKLSAIKTPRSLQNIPGFIAAVKPFAGTEYTFSSVFQDKESIDLLGRVHTMA